MSQNPQDRIPQPSVPPSTSTQSNPSDAGLAVLDIHAIEVSGPEETAAIDAFRADLAKVGQAEKNVVVIVNSSGSDVLTPGDRLSMSVTITNRGTESAVFNVWVDDLPTEMLTWWRSHREGLALGGGQSGEVVFHCKVPTTAQPNFYQYAITVDAPKHYPEETPIRYPQQLQILPAIQDVAHESDPTFIIQPTTQPQKPIVIQPGGGVPIQVLVHNRGDRVDQFRLTCPDLPPNWVQVTYPQSSVGVGVMLTPDSLKLNPGEQGVIVLLISLPIDALAGNPVATLRIHSTNNPMLLMSDWVYLQITATHLLQSELRTVINKVQNKSGLFQVRLTNLGNAPRELNLAVKNLEESSICAYHLDRHQVKIEPKATIGIDLTVTPQLWWQRPLYGGPKMFNFAIELEDQQQLPLPSDRLTNFIIWEPRPFWQFLPVLLLILAGLGTIAYGIWWAFIRVPEPPKILNFEPEANQYQSLNDEAVRLAWRISDPDRIEKLTIQGLGADGKPMTLPMVYDISKGLPDSLKKSCFWKQELICQNIRTSALKPGEYIFSLTTTAKPGRGAADDTKKTVPVKIEPIPKPQIISFNSTQPIYQEPSGTSIGPTANPAASPTPTPTPLANPSPNPTPNLSPSPSPNAALPNAEIALNWTIGNPRQLQEIHLIAKAADGKILSPLKKFNLTQGLPDALKPFCKVAEQLVCQNVPTGDRKPGQYIYEIAAIGIGEGAIAVQKSDVIQLLPKPARIVNLTLNGQPATLPKYLVPITPNQPVNSLLLAWEIDASEGSKVELLPAPGNIPLQGALPFPINPTPGALTLTLQVTPPGGAPIARTIVIETYDPNASNPAATAAAAAAAAIANANAEQAAAAAAAGSPAPAGGSAPSNAAPLGPIDLPPQTN